MGTTKHNVSNRHGCKKLKPIFEGCLYVCGGAILEDGDGIDLVQKYDSKTNEWTETASMLIPRSGSAACVLDKYIYVIGMIRCLFKPIPLHHIRFCHLC